MINHDFLKKIKMDANGRVVKPVNFQFSIITSVRNCLDETTEFIRSLQKFSEPLDYELIIIDDGSEAETAKYLESIRDARLFRNQQSRGFAYSNNLGASQAKGDWLIFMNNDLVLTKGWFIPFTKSLVSQDRRFSKVGCVGNVQIDPRTQKIDHAGVSFKEGIPSHHLFGEKKAGPDEFSEFLAVTGACFLLKKDVFLNTGGFDEDYKTGFEDIDLCLRLRMLGYRHFVANESVIFHKRSSTPQRNEHQEHNSKVFYGRWSKLITRFQEWERVNHASKTKLKNLEGKNYLFKNPERFLFADQKLLEDFLARFLSNSQFIEAENLIKIYEGNLFGEVQTALLTSKLNRKKGELLKAKSIIEQLVKNGHGKEPCVIMEYAKIEQKSEKFSSARRKYNTLVSKRFNPETCLMEIGECYLAEGKYKKAEDSFTKVILLYPGSFRGWKKLAVSRNKQGDLHQEIEALTS